jgi:V/A-type H+/Na+-transporting ATPase subunit F
VKFFCIADQDTVRGFRLAGVAGQVVNNPAEAEVALAQAAGQAEWGVLLLSQSVANGVRQQVEALRLERERPLLVEIPGPEGPLPGRKSLHQVVQEAVGLRLEGGGGA